jgi:hypothetical protein
VHFQQGVHKHGSAIAVLFATELSVLEFCSLAIRIPVLYLFFSLSLSPASWNGDSLEELTSAELVNKCLLLYGVGKFITVFKRALLLELLLSQMNIVHTHHPLPFCLPSRFRLLYFPTQSLRTNICFQDGA